MKTLLLSDIHGNWPALQAVLAAEPKVDQILCLGDVVNRCKAGGPPRGLPEGPSRS